MEDQPKHRSRARPRYGPDAEAAGRERWRPWCRQLTRSDADAEAALGEVMAALQAGLGPDAVAALVRTRLGVGRAADQGLLASERAYHSRVLAEAGDLRGRGELSAAAAAALSSLYSARLALLRKADEPILRPVAPRAAAEPAMRPAREAPPAAAAEPAPSGPSFSLREFLGEHSVVILASLGAFLLVVATVLFELYGTAAVGGVGRLAAVVALNLLFAVAAYISRDRDRLRAVSRIYLALAAVLLPLVGVAAFSFLELGKKGITDAEATAATGAACAAVYGILARRLDLRAYAEMAALGALLALLGASVAVLGGHWFMAGLALAPALYAVWARLWPARVFSHLPAFAHFGAAVALFTMISRHQPWAWTLVLAVAAASYLLWQALSPATSRGWPGLALAVLAAAAASAPLGGWYRFAYPLAAGAAMLVLARRPDRLGRVGALYRSHPLHLLLGVTLGLGIALSQNRNGEAWPLALALWGSFALYAADFGLSGSVASGRILRLALAAALAAAGRAAGWGPWTASLVAAAGLAYLLPHLRPARLKPLTGDTTLFLYALQVAVALELHDALIRPGRWEVVAALLVSAAAFAAASELEVVRHSALAARILFSGAWFLGVEVLGAAGWRGPFDAGLALLYTGLARLRQARRHGIATARRRELVHAAAAVSLGLCFAGPQDLLWWRLAAAFGLLAAAYWWAAATTEDAETPVLAWSAVAAAAASTVLAAAPAGWQGPLVAAAGVALTLSWSGARRLGAPERLEAAGLPPLILLLAVGLGLTLRDEPPAWSQSEAALTAAAGLAAWSLLPSARKEIAGPLRAAAGCLAAAGLLLTAAVLGLEAPVAGLLVLALAAAHAEWRLRTPDEIERRYALVALLALGPILYLWPYPDGIPVVAGLELAAVAAVTVQLGIRERAPATAYPAVLQLSLALLLGMAGSRLPGNLQESAVAALAWACGVTGLVLQARAARSWARAAELGALTVAAAVLVAMASSRAADEAGIALLAFAPVVYTSAMQERLRWLVPAAAATALAGAFTLLLAHQADTLLYPAALGVAGVLTWSGGRLAHARVGRNPLVEMHRLLGLGLLAVAALAGFAFPDRTGAWTAGAALAAAALLVLGLLLWMDAHAYGFRPGLYLAAVSASSAGFFLARELDLRAWELVPSGLGIAGCGLRLREEPAFDVDVRLRQLIVAAGALLAMGWAGVQTVEGDLWWMVALLVEGALTVAAGIAFRSRVLLAGGGAALALVSFRALLLVAAAGYLFVAFGAVALVLLAVATALALGHGRHPGGPEGLMGELARWD